MQETILAIAGIFYMCPFAHDYDEGLTICIAGDIFLAAASISYVGPFTGIYRDRLVQGWRGRCQDLGVPVSDPFSLQATLASPMSIREWTLQVPNYQNDSIFTSSQ